MAITGPKKVKSLRLIEFGNRLNAARVRKGWTQKQLAEEIGLSLSMVRCYEQGVHGPSLEMAERIRKTLGVVIETVCPHCRRPYDNRHPFPEESTSRLRRELLPSMRHRKPGQDTESTGL